jgi:3'-5' exoribonuclease
LAYNRSFSYTTRGQLLGHMVIELEMVHAKIAQIPNFPSELKTLVEHLIISHHGQYEFGSPKLPMFPEALVLHYLDDLDSKMESMRAHFAREVCSEGVWTGYNPSLARPLLNTSKFLEKKSAATAEAVVHATEPEAAAQEKQSMAQPEGSEPAPTTDSMAAAAGPEKI